MHTAKPQSDFSIKLLKKKDISALHALERASFALPWNEEQFAKAMEQEAFKAFGLFEEQQLIGYLSSYMTEELFEIINIAISPEKRRQGHGARLLAFVLLFAKKSSIFNAVLEVNENNKAAIALYTAQGFTLAGRRKNYYTTKNIETNTVVYEDALIYTSSQS